MFDEKYLPLFIKNKKIKKSSLSKEKKLNDFGFVIYSFDISYSSHNWQLDGLVIMYLK